MKLSLLGIILVTFSTASAIVIQRDQAEFQPLFRVQDDAPQAVFIEDQELPSLSVEDFHQIQDKIEDAILSAADKVADFAAGFAGIGRDDVRILPAPAGEGADFTDEAVWDVDADGEGDDTLPPRKHLPRIIDFTQYTILEILNASLHYNPEANDDRPHSSEWKWPFPRPEKPPTQPQFLPLHRLGWLVNRSSEAQADLAKDGITLLAPDDQALTPPHRRARSFEPSTDEGDRFDWHMEMWSQQDEERQEQPMAHPFYSPAVHGRKCRKGLREAAAVKEEHDDDKAAHISKIIGYILKYHTLSSVQTGWQLAQNSTIGTTLKATSEGDEVQRIHVDFDWALLPVPHPALKFNFYSVKRGLSIKAKNGYIHLISAPLLPPFTPLNRAFLFPQIFATLTTSIQKVGLAEALLPSDNHYSASDLDINEVDTVSGPEHPVQIWESLVSDLKTKATPFTVFAPTNWAFDKLGFKNLALLSSPFPLAKKVLKAVLQYHVVPGVVFYSDYINNQTALAEYRVKDEINVDVDPSWINDYDVDAETAEFTEIIMDLPVSSPPMPPFGGGPSPPDHPRHHPHGKANITHYTLPTLLSTAGGNPNATLNVAVVSYRRFDKGPVRRAVVVLPHHFEHEHHDVEAKQASWSWGGHDNDKPKPVKAWKSDVPARNGAIHVIGEVLRPPYHHHCEHGKEEFAGRRRHYHKQHGYAQFFA